MADSKEVPLSIILRTVDKATAGIQAVNKRLDAITKPTRELGKALSDLGEKSGLNAVVEGFRGVGGAIQGILGKLAVVGGVAGLAVHGVVSLVEEFDNLGDKAEKLDVSVDFLAAMRNAAELSGSSIESLDQGLTAFGENMGQLRGGTGRMLKSLQQWAPALVPMLKATKGNEEGFLLLADAMSKVSDPQKRLALALKTVGNSDLVPLLAKGPAGLKEMQAGFIATAGSIEEATSKAGKTDDAFKHLSAATTGVKAALLTGLAPALTIIVEKMTAWLSGHRDDIKRWAIDIGEKLPAAVENVVKWVGRAIDKVEWLVGKMGGLRGVALALGAALVGPLAASFVNLGVVMLATPFGVVLTGLAAVAVAAGAATLAIKEMIDAMDTSHEKMLEDAATLPPGEFFRRNPQLAKLPRLRDLVWESNPMAPTEANAARIRVDFMNAPRGLRATIDPQSTADVDLTVGHNLGFGP